MFVLLLAAAVTTPAETAFQHMYNADFAGAQRVIDDAIRREPGQALYYSVRAAAHLFAEMDRLRILETDFFLNDDNIASSKKLKPDAAVRAIVYNSVEQARRLGAARLATSPDDRDALFAMCMASSVLTDYTALVERRQWRSVTLAADVNKYAQKLLALNPPFVDAYLNVGAVEYIVGSLPFFVRWFVRLDKIEGKKDKGMEEVKLVAQHGRYYAPYAKVLLAVACLREKRPREARDWLAEYLRDYPNNAIIRREFEVLERRLAAGK